VVNLEQDELDVLVVEVAPLSLELVWLWIINIGLAPKFTTKKVGI
jgi:hypothetical protein